jgi:hypothetical protein
MAAKWISPVLEPEPSLSQDDVEQFLASWEECDDYCQDLDPPNDAFLNVGQRIPEDNVEVWKRFLLLVPNFGLYKIQNGQNSDFTLSHFETPEHVSLLLQSANRSYPEFQEAIQHFADRISNGTIKCSHQDRLMTILLENGCDIETSPSIIQQIADYGYNHGWMTKVQRDVKKVIVDHLVFSKLIPDLIGKTFPNVILNLIIDYLGIKPVILEICHQSYNDQEFWRNCLFIDVYERMKHIQTLKH